MRTKILFFSLVLFTSYTILWGQPTSYGNLNQGNAGNGGGITNSFFGYEAGLNNIGGANTFIGSNSGQNTTTGSSNTFVGANSGSSNTSGGNTFIGSNSGSSNTNGNFNTYVGQNSGTDNITGDHNVFLGIASGANSTGSDNTFLGASSGNFNTGSGNVFIGRSAGYNEVGGSNLLYIANNSTPSPLIWGNFSSGLLRINGTLNINNEYSFPTNDGSNGQVLSTNGLGTVSWVAAPADTNTQLSDENVEDYFSSLVSNNTETLISVDYVDAANELNFVVEDDLSQYDNSISGFATLDSPTFTGTVTVQDLQLGSMNSLYFDINEFLHGRNQSVALGNGALGASMAKFNTAIGFQSMADNDSGTNNTAIGHEALRTNKTAANNVAIGYQAMRGKDLMPTSGNNNTAIGYRSLHFNEAGAGNVALGHSALLANTGGYNNVALGREALVVNVSGFENVAIGYNSGPTVGNDALQSTVAIGTLASVGDSFTTAIGSGAQAIHGNSTALGRGAITTSANQVMIGSSNFPVLVPAGTIGGYVGWSNFSDGRFKINVEENIAGLEFINKLRPVSYNIDGNKLNSFLKVNSKNSPESSNISAKQVGFIAQEVQEIIDKGGYIFSGVTKPNNDGDHYRLRYAEFVVPLVKGMQEQQGMIQNQQALIETLQRQNQILQQEMEDLKNTVYGNTTPQIVAKSNGKDFALYQNIPNPFDKTTTISARVPEMVSQAKITIYNLNGLELQSYDLNKRGNVTVEISGGVLPSGMYLYALIADGQIIDTKKMILTK